MTGSIEVYVRPASQGPIINIYVPGDFREAFFRTIEAEGAISSEQIPINFEMTILEEWTVQELGEAVGPHVKLSAQGLNVIVDD